MSAPTCDAARRNKQALYVLELDWGAGHVDIGKLKALLAGECPDCETTTGPHEGPFLCRDKDDT